MNEQEATIRAEAWFLQCDHAGAAERSTFDAQGQDLRPRVSVC